MTYPKDNKMVASDRRAKFEDHFYGLLEQMSVLEFDQRMADHPDWSSSLYHELLSFHRGARPRRCMNQKRILALRAHLLDVLEKEEKNDASITLR